MRRTAWRSLAVALVGSLAALAPAVLTSTSANAAPGYPVDICSTISVSTTTPAQGEVFDVTGVNFLPSTQVDLKLKPAPGNKASLKPVYDLTTVRTDSRGSFATKVKMPEATHSRGNFIIYAASGARNGSSCPADPEVKVQAASDGANNNNGPNSGPGETAFTGLNVLLLLLVAAALIAIGVYATRRGRTVSTTSLR